MTQRGSYKDALRVKGILPIPPANILRSSIGERAPSIDATQSTILELRPKLVQDRWRIEA